MFAYGSMKSRAHGRLWIKVSYSQEMHMSVLTVGDGLVELEVFLPTHKLSNLLADAFEVQANDPHAIGHNSWLEERVGGSVTNITA